MSLTFFGSPLFLIGIGIGILALIVIIYILMKRRKRAGKGEKDKLSNQDTEVESTHDEYAPIATQEADSDIEITESNSSHRQMKKSKKINWKKDLEENKPKDDEEEELPTLMIRDALAGEPFAILDRMKAIVPECDYRKYPKTEEGRLDLRRDKVIQLVLLPNAK